MLKKGLSLKSSEKLALLSNFSTMISAGIPILETIDSLLEDSKGNTRKILLVIKEDILQGNHLYSTFSKFPDVFDKVTVNVIRAAEEAGTLDVTLRDIKIQIERDMEFKDRIRSALVYPAVIFVVFIGVFLMILIVVIPKIAVVFSNLRVELPLPTRALIFLSDAIMKYTIPVLFGLFILGFLIFILFRTQKKKILMVFYKFPVVSTLIKDIDLANFSRSMYLLLSSGITITNALELAEEVVMRPDVAKAVRHAQETVLAGKNLSQAFKDNRKLFSGLVVKIIEAGEKTGSLDKSLEDVSKQMDYRVSNSLKNLTTMIEPIMLVAVGVLVGGMMLAIIAPIYGLIGQVSNK